MDPPLDFMVILGLFILVRSVQTFRSKIQRKRIRNDGVGSSETRGNGNAQQEREMKRERMKQRGREVSFAYFLHFL